jgi:uncharacterized protein (TIGR03437 family)
MDYLKIKLHLKLFSALSLAGLSILPGSLPAQQYVISTFAGGGFPATPAMGTNFTIGNPGHLTTDAAGNIYFVSLNCTFKLDTAGVLTRLAGTGAGGYSGDGGPATAAGLSAPHGLAIDRSGNLYIADTSNSRIRKVSSDGIITTVVGTGTAGYSGDGGPAVSAQLNYPGAVALDAKGNLYIFDSSNARVRKVSTSGIITTVAGNGTPGLSGDGGAATDAQIGTSGGLTLDKSGNLYVADLSGQRIRLVSAADRTITTVAGTMPLTPGESPVITGSGGPATQAKLNMPRDVAVDNAGNIYIAEATDIRVVSPDGIIAPIPGSTGPANDPFFGINTVALDGSGNFYVADATSRIRKISPSGAITIVAGPRGAITFSANEPATSAQFSGPQGVAVDSAGNVLVADTGGSWLWRVSPSGTIIPIGDPTNPTGVAVDSAGNYYAATTNQVWKAHFTGPVPPAPVVVASATIIGGIAVDSAGNLFLSDMLAGTVSKVTPAGVVTAVAGSGTRGYSGDGGQALSAQLSNPHGIAVDRAGNLYIADTTNYRIRKVTPGGIITTVAGGGTVSSPPPNPFPTGDGGEATSAILDFPTGVAVDGSGNIYVADQGFSRIRKITMNGIINTIGGNGTPGYSGDGGLATSASMNGPAGVAVDASGNVYVAELGNNIVRLLQPTNAPVLISAVVDAATESAIPVTPGKIVAIYGAGLGPVALALNEPSNGAFGTQVAGTSVTFNGVASPMIYASAGQTAAIVPYEIAGATVAQVVVTSPGGVSSAFSVPVAAAAPSFFSQNGSGTGQIAAVNGNGVLNDAANPIPVGGYISLYATGEGQTVPAGTDGALAMTVYPKPVLPVTVMVGGIAVNPIYAGAAPTEVLGLMQIVIQIPPGVQPGGYVPVELQVGSGSTVRGATWVAVSAN